MRFVFVIETIGRKVFDVEAESKEQACKLLASCGDEKQYLVESEDDWNLDPWSRKSIEEKLLDYIEDECE